MTLTETRKVITKPELKKHTHSIMLNIPLDKENNN